MVEFGQTYYKWRKMLFHTNVYLVFLVFLVEVLMYYILKNANLITQTTAVYLINFLVIPSVADTLIILVGYGLLKLIPPDSKYINYIPAVQMAFICLVVAYVHFIFTVTLCIFSIPILTTLIFSDKKMTGWIGGICGIFMLISLVHRRLSPYRFKYDTFFFEEAIVAFVILVASLIICNVLIKFQAEKDNTIHQGYLSKMQMQEQLNKDPKTGLYEHTFFMNTLDQMVSLSESTGRPIALAIIDIDDFKIINDTYGHLRGDEIILNLSDILKKHYKEDRFMARYGGEEFAVIFTGSEAENAYSFLEKIRVEFEELKHGFSNKKVTVSIGAAVWISGWNYEKLFENADSAMYASKARGKNRTTVFEPSCRAILQKSSSRLSS